jgi:hypothetical protein
MIRISICLTILTTILLYQSCKQAEHPARKGERIIYDKKLLECERRNWNRVPKSAGYVHDVVQKQEYKPVVK